VVVEMLAPADFFGSLNRQAQHQVIVILFFIGFR
jgi:hypothetical protein